MDLVKSASRNYQKLSSLPLQFWLFPLSVCLLKLAVMARTVVALAAAPGGSERAAGQRSVAAVGDSASQMGYWWEPIRGWDESFLLVKATFEENSDRYALFLRSS